MGKTTCSVPISGTTELSDTPKAVATLDYATDTAAWKNTMKRKDLPVPPSTRGFLYYHLPDPRHPAAGQVRFRTTTEEQPSSFDEGRDPLTPTGLPWAIAVPSIVRHSRYLALRQFLLREGLITDKHIQSYLDLKTAPTSSVPMISALKESFLWRGSGSLYLWVAHGSMLSKVRIDSNDIQEFHGMNVIFYVLGT